MIIAGMALATLATLALTACRTAPLPQYMVRIRTQPLPADLRQANRCQEKLPTALWLRDHHVAVTAGVGFTTAVVSAPATPEAEQKLLLELAGYNANHPMAPVHVQIKAP